MNKKAIDKEENYKNEIANLRNIIKNSSIGSNDLIVNLQELKNEMSKIERDKFHLSNQLLSEKLK